MTSGTDAPGRRLRPVFLLGVARRTGTNYLQQLLEIHPAVHVLSASKLGEDYLLLHAHHLEAYSSAVCHTWNRQWGYDPRLEGELRRALGDGIVRFMHRALPEPPPPEARVIVAKTPSTRNVGLLPSSIQDARIIIIVRDGRSVVASMMKGFRRGFDDAVRTWAEGAREAMEFRKAHPGGENRVYTIVRYEDLLERQEETLRRVFEFLELDAGEYDFEAARTAPLVGSSFVTKGEQVDWKPVEKPKDFDPRRRFAHWTRADHERYHWIVGDLHEALGYDVEHRADTGAAGLRQRLIDARAKASQVLRRALRRAGVRV